MWTWPLITEWLDFQGGQWINTLAATHPADSLSGIVKYKVKILKQEQKSDYVQLSKVPLRSEESKVPACYVLFHVVVSLVICWGDYAHIKVTLISRLAYFLPNLFFQTLRINALDSFIEVLNFASFWNAKRQFFNIWGKILQIIINQS